MIGLLMEKLLRQGKSESGFNGDKFNKFMKAMDILNLLNNLITINDQYEKAA